MANHKWQVRHVFLTVLTQLVFRRLWRKHGIERIGRHRDSLLISIWGRATILLTFTASLLANIRYCSASKCNCSGRERPKLKNVVASWPSHTIGGNPFPLFSAGKHRDWQCQKLEEPCVLSSHRGLCERRHTYLAHLYFQFFLAHLSDAFRASQKELRRNQREAPMLLLPIWRSSWQFDSSV